MKEDREVQGITLRVPERRRVPEATTITIRLPVTLETALKERVRSDGLTVSEALRQLIELYLGKERG